MKNEPAFPGVITELQLDAETDKLYPVGAPGLTKREYFAAMAMQSLILNGECKNQEISILAKCSISCADALIQELEKSERKD